MSQRCPNCGRFCVWDGYLGRWVCENCEREVKVPVPQEEGTP